MTAPWQLFAVSALSGAGWGAMSAAALNAIVSPWFVRSRPAALAMAYNGGSIGGVIFSPLWVAAIGALGFPLAAAAIGGFMAVTMWVLADAVFSRTPQQMGLTPDGDAPGTPAASVTSPAARPLPGALLWRDRRFLTLAAGMGLGLFAQIGLVAHLFSLLVPALGAQRAGLAMGLVTVLAIAGRTLLAWMMPLGADRRLVACVGYALQLAGSLTLVAAAGDSVPLLLLGRRAVRRRLRQRHVAAAAHRPGRVRQGGRAARRRPHRRHLAGRLRLRARALRPDPRARAPRSQCRPGAAPHLFLAAALVQGLAIAAFLAGRRR